MGAGLPGIARWLKLRTGQRNQCWLFRAGERLPGTNPRGASGSPTPNHSEPLVAAPPGPK